MQKVGFKNTAAKDLYDLYLNSKAFRCYGAAAIISAKEGGKYSGHNPRWLTDENLKA